MNALMVAKEFSPFLGGRYRRDGEFSGEEFRDDVLEPRARTAIQKREPLRINFDGVAGMPTSFVEEAFGGLARMHPDWSVGELSNYVTIEAPRSPLLWPFIELATRFMLAAAKNRSRD
ncbi:MAG TPA: STAS-like domain-containing protein [Caulobacteraceae bacterium]